MQKFLIGFVALTFGCSDKVQTHPPVGGFLSDKDLSVSKNRTKNLNETERVQIQYWISNQTEKFYPMRMNYWISVENLDTRLPKKDGEVVSYSYDLYDFDLVKLNENPIGNTRAVLGRFEELKAVEDALRYLPSGSGATLLVPSVLAFGTYGDGDKIPNDMPLIIKIKVL